MGVLLMNKKNLYNPRTHQKKKEALREEIRQAEEKKKKRDKELMDSRFPQTKKNYHL